jgi:hypothetical protein
MSKERAKEFLRHLVKNPDLMEITREDLRVAAQEMKDSGELTKGSFVDSFAFDSENYC